MRFLALAVIASSLSNCTLAFGTVDNVPGLGQSSEHEKITRAALACRTASGKSDGTCFESKSLDELAGDLADFGAVGDPDHPHVLSLQVGEAAEAHGDNADYLKSDPNYPQKRTDATAVLLKTINHLRKRLGQGVDEALGMLDSKGFIHDKSTDLGFNGCEFEDDPNDSPKCKSLLGFGRALHGVQDFYSHSNWGDRADPPYSAVNPPGLAQLSIATFLDLRSTTGEITIPEDLATGCFDDSSLDAVINKDKTPGVGKCLNRITHHTLNKDKGTIDDVTGVGTAPTTERGKLFNGYNFRQAVRLAVTNTREQWRFLRYELHKKHGDLKASRMICALTRDDAADCRGRKIAIVVDSSSSNLDTDPSNLRIAAAKSFNSKLITAAQAETSGKADLVTVIDFDTSARVISPMDDPSKASFAGIDSSGGTSIASGIRLAIDEIQKNTQYSTFLKSGIVVFTDGEDSNRLALVAQIVRATANGIRVSMGLLSPRQVTPLRRRSLSGNFGHEFSRRQSTASTDILTAVLRSGGVYSVINSAKAQEEFVNLVYARGPTVMDDNSGSTSLKAGLSVASLITGGEDTAKYFTYTAQAGESLNITVKSISALSLNAELLDIRGNTIISRNSVPGLGKQSFLYVASSEIELELSISVLNGTSNSTEGLITIELNTVSNQNFSTSSSTTSSTVTTTATTTAITTTAITSTTNKTTSSTSVRNSTYTIPTYQPSSHLTGPISTANQDYTMTTYVTTSLTYCPVTLTRTIDFSTTCITTTTTSMVAFTATELVPCTRGSSGRWTQISATTSQADVGKNDQWRSAGSISGAQPSSHDRPGMDIAPSTVTSVIVTHASVWNSKPSVESSHALVGSGEDLTSWSASKAAITFSTPVNSGIPSGNAVNSEEPSWNAPGPTTTGSNTKSDGALSTWIATDPFVPNPAATLTAPEHMNPSSTFGQNIVAQYTGAATRIALKTAKGWLTQLLATLPLILGMW